MEVEPVMRSQQKRPVSRDWAQFRGALARAALTRAAERHAVSQPRGSWVCAALLPLTIACAAPASPSPEYPRSEAICQYVGLESVETPQRTDHDSVSFVATYRFREPHTPSNEAPVGVKFLVNRTRAQELRSHLESQPEVVCAPENDQHYHVKVKPLPEPEPAGITTIPPAPDTTNALPSPTNPPVQPSAY
jgi:hypothetical protein